MPHSAPVSLRRTENGSMLPARRNVPTFELITYNTPETLPAPRSWEVSDPMELDGADELPLRPLNCGTIIIDSFVTYYDVAGAAPA